MTRFDRSNTSLVKAVATLVVVGAAAVALVACGSSSSGSTTAVAAAQKAHAIRTQKAHPTLAQSNPDVGAATAQSSTTPRHGKAKHSARSQVPTSVRPAGQVQRARQAAGITEDDKAESGSRALNPCALVSLSEAEAITGGAIHGRVEAPLGPTCVYKLNSKRYITMTIETVSPVQVTRHLKSPKSLDIRGHRAYCARLGAEMLFVPLGPNRLLNVTAPCALGQHFAARALTRLPAA
jgi:hypothetical protein